MGILSGFKRLFRVSQLNSMAERLFSGIPPEADARIAYGDDPLQFGDLRLPKEHSEGPLPTVIVIHGGFWRSRYTLDHIGHLCAALTSNGVATWSVEYRRLGDEGGGWPNTLLDVGMACDHLRALAGEYNLDLGRVVVTGHSAGGHLAAWVAGRHRIPEDNTLYVADPLPVAACVPLAGVVDLQLCWHMKLSNGVVVELMGGSPQDVPERYAGASPGDLLPIGVKQVLIHGTADPNVPYEISDLYVARAKALGDDAELVPLKGTGHFEVIDPMSKEWPVVRERILGAIPK
jgi:acetyl esterase/lipase